MGDLGTIFGLALLAMFNPTLLAAVTVMLLLPEPKKLMLGYLLGALLTSISVGLLIVFTLHGTDSAEAARKTLSPLQDVVVGCLLLIVAYVLLSGRGEQLRERRQRRKEAKAAGKEKKESLPERMLGRGSARITFAVGVVLTFPGVSYLAALDRMAKMDLSSAEVVLLVLVFCLIQQMFLELPLLGYALRPEWTKDAVTRFREWLAREGRRAGGRVALVLGALLVVRGAFELLT